MSTKTLRKRIALVAVSALTAGLVSVVAVPAAYAAGGDYAASSQTAGSTGLLSAPVFADGKTTMTATLISTGSLKLTTAAAAGYFEVSAGGRITNASDIVPASGLAADQGSVITASGEFFTVTPVGATGTSFTISGFTSSAKTTLSSVITVTIAASSVAGTVTAADSGVFWHTSAAEVTADTSGASATTAGNKLFLDLNLADAYGAAITAATGALVVTATTGANVNLVTTGSTTGTFTTAVSSVDPSTLYAVINETTTGAGWSGSVTVSYNGTLIATKTGTITGYAAVITTTRNKVATASTTTTDAVRFKATDSAGNAVVITAATLTMKSSSSTSVVSDVVGATNQNITAGSTADGKATVTCGTPGTSSVVMQHTTPAFKTITSAPLTVTCGSSASTYTAAFNKAVYTQGELATLTVSFKDSFGSPAATSSAVTAVANSLSNEIIVAPMMTLVGAVGGTALVTNADGNVVFTYSVGATTGITPGAYQASVSFPTVNSAKGVAQAVSYTVSAPAGVSNADVLKAIVSLIASINKQIAALQKALLKR